PELGLYHIRHPLPTPAPLVSIIIPSRDKKNILEGCIESIVHKTRYPNWEILIVDNQSTETTTLDYLEAVQQHPRIQVLRYDHPFNFSAINNFAVEQARGEVLALVNNDVEIITPEWLDEMVSHSLQPGIGAVGAKLLYENNTIQHAGVILGIGGVAGHAHKNLAQDAPGYRNRAMVAQNLSAVTGACLVVRKKLYQEVGGLNAADFAVAFNDIDFCLKLAAQGYRNVFTPHAVLYHHESISRGHDDTPEKQTIFNREFHAMKRIWGSTLQKDPAYNPNLSTDFEGFTLKIR
ncbi:MAG: glycosyltransferase family 2 protein, partial [Desulfobulbus sp.]|nr:glycosyltransferase family 2 protein [Desulfobulbus sp.]